MFYVVSALIAWDRPHPAGGDDLGVHSTAGLDRCWSAVGTDLGIQSAGRSQEMAFSKLAPVRYRWLRAGA
jgi:hypothetical protein